MKERQHQPETAQILPQSLVDRIMGEYRAVAARKAWRGMERPELPLEGQQIVLRGWQHHDLKTWSFWLEPGHPWKELDGPYYPLPSAEERAAMLDQKRAEIQDRPSASPPRSLVIAGRHSDAFLGIVTWYWESKETLWPGLGIVIFDQTQWSRGIGYEALGLWTDFLFRAMPEITRLDLRTWSGNRGMMRLAEKLGYREEARFRQARIVGDEFYDGLGYGILREEWLRRHPDGFTASTCDR